MLFKPTLKAEYIISSPNVSGCPKPEEAAKKVEILAPKKPRQRKDNVVTLSPEQWSFLQKLRTEGPYTEVWLSPTGEKTPPPPVSPYSLERDNLIKTEEITTVDPGWVYDPTSEYGVYGVDPGEQKVRDTGIDKIHARVYTAVPWDASDPRQVGPVDEVGSKSGVGVPYVESWDALAGGVDSDRVEERFGTGTKPVPRVDGEPPKYAFRAMSGAEWDAAVAQGFIQARDNSLTFAALSPDLRYLDGPTPGQRIVKLRYDEADGWQTSWTGDQIDVANLSPIPMDRVVAVTPPGNARDIITAWREMSEVGSKSGVMTPGGGDIPAEVNGYTADEVGQAAVAWMSGDLGTQIAMDMAILGNLSNDNVETQQHRYAMALLNYLDASPTTIDAPLFRGFIDGKDPSYTVGQVLNLQPSSFSYNPTVAQVFSEPDVKDRISDYKGVVFILAPGSKGFPLSSNFPSDAIPQRYQGEQEVLTSGSFEVTGVEPGYDGRLKVRIAQTEPFTLDMLARKNWDGIDWEQVAKSYEPVPEPTEEEKAKQRAAVMRFMGRTTEVGARSAISPLDVMAAPSPLTPRITALVDAVEEAAGGVDGIDPEFLPSAASGWQKPVWLDVARRAGIADVQENEMSGAVAEMYRRAWAKGLTPPDAVNATFPRKDGSMPLDSEKTPEWWGIEEGSKSAISPWKRGTGWQWERPQNWYPDYPGQENEIDPPEVPTEEDHLNAAHYWKGDPSEVRWMQQEVLEGNGLPTWASVLQRQRRRLAASMMNAVAEAEPFKRRLYRGFKTNEPLDFTVGEEITVPLRGFSARPSHARNFGRTSGRAKHGYLFVAAPGVHAFSIDEFVKGSFQDEEEYIAAGTFRVTAVDVSDGSYKLGNTKVPAGTTVINIEQTEALGAPEGGWM